VDLSRFAGKQIALQMITAPGSSGDVSYDWALWSDARVDAGAEQGALGFDLIAPTPVAAAVPRAKSTASAPCRYHFEGGGRSLWAGLLYEVRKVSPPAKLIDVPFSVAVVTGGIGKDGSVHGSGMTGQVEMRGVALRAIGAHPPTEGGTYLDWPLALPAEPCRLRLRYGVKDGGQSVIFMVAANGETLWQERVREPVGWRETVVDLSKWAGQSVLLSLITDSDGLNNCDWAQWGEPTLER
jgi:hypothetical protein